MKYTAGFRYMSLDCPFTCPRQDTVLSLHHRIRPTAIDTGPPRLNSDEMRRRLRIVAVVLLAATLAAMFSAALAMQVERSAGRTPDVWSAVLLNASFWYGWALLS